MDGRRFLESGSVRGWVRLAAEAAAVAVVRCVPDDRNVLLLQAVTFRRLKFERRVEEEEKQVGEPGLSEVGDQGRKPAGQCLRMSLRPRTACFRAQPRVVPQDDCNPTLSSPIIRSNGMRHFQAYRFPPPVLMVLWSIGDYLLFFSCSSAPRATLNINDARETIQRKAHD